MIDDEGNDPMRKTELGRRVDDDTWRLDGRERQLLVEYGYQVMQAVIAARVVVDDQRADWIIGDIERWDEFSPAPLSTADRTWLLEYVLKLVAKRDQTSG